MSNSVRIRLPWLLVFLVAACAQAEQRVLPLEGNSNARDLGGYVTEDGRKVRWGVLFRSDTLAELSDADVEALAALQLAAVTDFRGDAEREGAADRLPVTTPPIRYSTLPIVDPGVNVAELGRKVYAGELSEAELLALTDRRGYVTNADTRRMWGEWVSSLADANNLPHLFHCTAGKDRTGYAAALILLTLGVSREQVMDDFLMSNELLSERIDTGVAKIREHTGDDLSTNVLRQVLGVTPASLNGAFDEMEAQYGSIDAFIEEGLGVDADTRARLRALLLE